MAEVRCLFCGKNNPPTAEKCQFCGERLVTDSSTSHEGGESDWLSGLRGGNWDESNVPVEEPPADATANTEFPDWLNRVRARSDEDQKTPESAEPAGDDLDWLAGLGAAPAQSEGSADDWLNTLNSPVQPPSGQPEASFDSKPAEPSSDDWMKNLSDWNTPGEPAGEQPSAAEPAPDFNFFAEETPAPAQEPDWFNVAQEAPSAPAQEADWLSAASSLPSTPPAEPASTDMPDWLRQLNQTAPPPETPQAETPEIEIPDWLSSSPAQVAPAQPEPPATEAELPDWLAGFTGTAAVAADAAAEPAAPETPDWLSAGLPAQPSAEPAVPDLFDQTGIAAANEVQPEQPAPDFAFLSESSEPVKESLPDFSALFADEPAAGDAGSGAPPADLPDFSALAGFDEAQPSSQPPAIPGAEEEKPDLNLGSVLGALGAAGIAAASAAASAASQPEEPAQPQAETPEEMPDWLSSFGEAE
ncbi:MAG: hypothetical protein HY835_02605, partial [Anaerolineae bacterium]|nr:hypothetical protein [Anaerolineae bacterium]